MLTTEGITQDEQLVFKNSLTQYITKYISCHNPLALTFGHHLFREGQH
jgi:hypothetical protein